MTQKSAREYLDEDLEAVIGGGFPMGNAPQGFSDFPPGPGTGIPHVPPGMMPGYYPIDTNRIYPAMLGTTPAADSVPFYKRPLVTFAAGGAAVGAAWFYFGYWRHRNRKGGKK